MNNLLGLLGRKRFSPASIPGLLLDLCNPSINPVSAWASGAKNFVQAIGSQQPALVSAAWNGKNLASFDGGDLLRYAGTLTTATEGTLFAVFSIDNRTGDVSILSSNDEGSASYWWILRISSGLIKITQRNSDTEDRVVIPTASLLSTGKAHIVTIQSSGTLWTIRMDGAPQTLTVQSGSNNGDWFGDTNNRDNFVLGALKVSSEAQFLAGDIGRIVLFDTNLSLTNVRRVENYLNAYFGISQVVFDGNSMTLGTGASSGQDYPMQTIDTLAGNYAHHNLGVSGQTTADMSSDAGTQVDPIYASARPKNILVAWEGTNDLYLGASAAQAYANLVAYCQARRAAGWKVVILTILPRSNAGTPGTFEADRTTVNTNIRTNWASFADGLADVAANTDIGEAGDSENVTFYTDKVHMTDAGYAIVAGIVAACINGLA